MQQSIEREQVTEQSPSPSPADGNFQTQVMRYSAWLRKQAERDPRENLRETNEYAARASRIVEVGTRQIQTFAPFRYKYSALRTITIKQGIV